MLMSMLASVDLSFYDTLKDAVNTLGIPALMLAYFIWDKTKVTSAMTTAINNNNRLLAKLLVKLGYDDLDMGDKDE